MKNITLTTTRARTCITFLIGLPKGATTGQVEKAKGRTHSVRLAGRGPAWLRAAARKAGYELVSIGYTNGAGGWPVSTTYGLMPPQTNEKE